MKKEINTLFSLFRCALFGEVLDEETKAECSEKAEIFYKMSRHHDLAHLVKYAYDISGIGAKDAAADFELLRFQAMSVLRYENTVVALENVSALFEEEKIAFIPLKGSVIRDLYPEPWMRTSCDIDILVREEDFVRAKTAIVEKLGYRASDEQGYHDVSLYSDTDVHLELHFSIKENMENIDRLLDKVWQYAYPESEGSCKYRMTDEFFLFQTVAHMAYHVVGGGCGIRNFIDLFLLDKKVGYDKQIFTEMLEMCGIKRFYDVASKLSAIWFSDEKHDETTLLFQKFLLDGGVYGTKSNSIAAGGNKKSTMSYLFGRVFMSYDKLCIKYPVVKEKPYLAPFYHVRRFVSAIGKGSASRVRKDLKANNSVTENDIIRYEGLFGKLGL